jgi:hypothetical protein
MPRYTFAYYLPRGLNFITIWAWASGRLCGTLRNRDVAREPTWMYLRRSRKDVPMTAPQVWN